MKGISMQEYLRDKRTLRVEAFNPIRSEVLSLLKLEDVLFSINDPKAVVLGIQLCHISSLEPSILSDGLPGHIRLLVIAKEDLRTSQPNLPPWAWMSLLINVFRSVLHFRDIG
jgi:hypothetical protein